MKKSKTPRTIVRKKKPTVRLKGTKRGVSLSFDPPMSAQKLLDILEDAEMDANKERLNRELKKSLNSGGKFYSLDEIDI